MHFSLSINRIFGLIFDFLEENHLPFDSDGIMDWEPIDKRPEERNNPMMVFGANFVIFTN